MIIFPKALLTANASSCHNLPSQDLGNVPRGTLHNSASRQLKVNTRFFLRRAEVMRPRYAECMASARNALKESANMSMKQPARFSELVVYSG